jgi:hypothetical protein
MLYMLLWLTSHRSACRLLPVSILQLAVKHYITIIESMTEKELDSTNVKIFQEPSRITRLAIGSGTPPLLLLLLPADAVACEKPLECCLRLAVLYI